MAGIVSFGAYIPYWRLQRERIAEALRTPPGKGTRAVASYDEDTTSMAVEAARLALRPVAVRPTDVVLATANPAYLDKTNAAVVHAALGLEQSVSVYDFGGAVRSGMGAMRFGRGLDRGLVVLSDVRTGLPGGADEAQGGDGAAAFLWGDDGVVAEPLAFAGSSAEFLDRWRLPGEPASHVWEERFGEQAYVPLAEAALTDALKQAGLTSDTVDHLIVTGTHDRAARQVRAAAGVNPAAIVDDLSRTIGNAGTAQPGILLAATLERAAPGETIVLVVLSDGCEVSVWRTTKAIASFVPAVTVAQQVASGRDDLTYPTFLTWRGRLDREPPRRPDPDRPSAPPSLRRADWKFAFSASRCEACGTRHLPPARVCVRCRTLDQMSPEALADVPATIATFTVDRLAYSLNPPVVAAAVDFDGGGRFQCELTDVDPAAVAIGDRVEMTFRRLFTAEGVHNYFWKARPIRERG